MAAAMTTTARPIHHDRNEIRMRLLHRLGIQRNESDLHSHHHGFTQRNKSVLLDLQISKRRMGGSSTKSNGSCTSDIERQQKHEQSTIFRTEYTLPLQYTAVDTLPSFEKKPRIQFLEGVKVREIPNRNDYDEVAKSRMWSSLQEIHDAALRNDFEFFVDGENWESCKEEDEFLLWNDELVHPATFERYEQQLLGDDDDDELEEQTTAMTKDFPTLSRGESVYGDSREGSMEDERNKSTRKRKSNDDEFSPSPSPLRRSAKVSSFAELSDNSESEENSEEMSDQ